MLNRVYASLNKFLQVTFYILAVVGWLYLVCYFTGWLSFMSVYGMSMEPTYSTGDINLVSNIPLMKNRQTGANIHINDVIILRKPIGEVTNESKLNRFNSVALIKRVVGLPGDVLIFFQDKYSRNGEIVDDKNLTPEISPPNYSTLLDGNESKTIVIPQNRYFVMGDNRNFSDDSRVEDIGYINLNQIQGKVICTLIKGSTEIEKTKIKHYSIGDPIE